MPASAWTKSDDPCDMSKWHVESYGLPDRQTAFAASQFHKLSYDAVALAGYLYSVIGRGSLQGHDRYVTRQAESSRDE